MRSMKKILYILLPMLFALAACTEEMHFQDDTLGKDCIMLKVFNNPMTKVSDIGLDYERHLSRLDVFFYVEGQTDQNCVYYQPVTDPQYLTGAAEIPFYVVEEQINQIFPNGNSTCDVLVIANLPESKRTFDTDPDGGYENTEYNRLTAISLEMEQKDAEGNKLPQHYDAIDKDFVMAGFDGNVTKDNNNNASGEVKLVRAASKITVTVNVPEKIILDEGTDNPVTMVPVFEEMGESGQKMVSLKTAFFNGVSQGKVFPSGLIDDGMSVLPEDCYFETDKFRYTFVKEIPATTADGVKRYQYTCEVPFYSYPSVWQKGDEHAAHFSFELPWQNKNTGDFQPYYYQILINGAERRLDPNHWYDLIVNVGVVGSSVELAPVELKDMSVYVLDWTTEPDPEDTAGGDRYENLEIEQYTYFSVPQKRIEMNNTTVGKLNFDASHSVKWKLEWPADKSIQSTFDEMELEYHTGTVAAYYINCGGDSPVAKDLSRFIQESDFSLSASGTSLTFNFPKAEIDEYNENQTTAANKYSIYSPVFIHLKVWLDINGDGQITTDLAEDDFLEYVTFVYYPAMYVEPDLSHPYSIWVNNRQTSSDITINPGNHNIGRNPGHSGNSWNGKASYMYTVTVSSFNSDDKFLAHDGKEYSYIIGDPRQRVSDIELDDNNANVVATNWASSNAITYDENGDIIYTTRSLQYYYPTGYADDAFRIVSPKFRIVSFHSSGWGNITSKGAAMRCATFQEDGFPAGRWRLPTEAEIMFVIGLQDNDAISDVFYGSSQYYSSTVVDATHNWRIVYPDKTTNPNAKPYWYNDDTNGSVRCVYDEWYWGSEREAKPNPSWNGSHTTSGQNEYLFTWGDRQIWPE